MEKKQKKQMYLGSIMNQMTTPISYKNDVEYSSIHKGNENPEDERQTKVQQKPNTVSNILSSDRSAQKTIESTSLDNSQKPLPKTLRLKPHPTKKPQSSWTRSSYFEIRQAKLQQQAPRANTSLLQNLHFYFTGVKSGGQRQLEGLVWRNGGSVHRIWHRRVITHVIADNLAASKVEKELQVGAKWSGVILKPSWLVQSVKKQKLLPTWEYRVIKGPPGVKDVAKFFQKRKPNSTITNTKENV